MPEYVIKYSLFLPMVAFGIIFIYKGVPIARSDKDPGNPTKRTGGQHIREQVLAFVGRNATADQDL